MLQIFFRHLILQTLKKSIGTRNYAVSLDNRENVVSLLLQIFFRHLILQTLQSREFSEFAMVFVHFVFKAEILIDTLTKEHKMAMIRFDRKT